MGAQERTHLFFISVHTVTGAGGGWGALVKVHFHLGCKWDIFGPSFANDRKGRWGEGGSVCLRSWCARRRNGVLKKSERRGSQTAGEQGDKWEGERGRCQASVIRAQCVFYWMTRGDGDGGRVVAQGHGWQIAALEGNWAPSMRQEWRGGKQQ